MKNFSFWLMMSSVLLMLSACNKDKIPGVYRIDIQQGNDITQEMVNKLAPNMTKAQVAYVLGTPLIADTFNDNRWDYLYSFHPGNGSREQRRLTLFFKDNKLDYIDGDTRVVEHSETNASVPTGTNVVVPLKEKKTGLWQGLLNTVGLGKDEPEVIQKGDEIKTKTSEKFESEIPKAQ